MGVESKVVIIGNGISGSTCARWCRKLGNPEITMISSESEYFFSRTALMYVYMGHLRAEDLKPYEDWFWKKNRIDLVQGEVTQIDIENKQVILSDDSKYSYDKLVLALGSKSNKFGWPGQDLKGVGGLYHWQDLENMEKYTPGLQRAVIVGGGLIGIEMAEMFHSRSIPVTMLVREESYWNNVLPEEESQMITNHIRHHGIDLRLGLNLGSIHDNGQGEAEAITIKETDEKIACGYVGLTAGVSPNISIIKESAIETGRGIKVNDFLETSVKDIYAIGDCAELLQPQEGRRPVEAIWYTGRMMGETAAHNMMGTPTQYDPGIWFNSAKFIDIEYQVYGAMPNKLPDDANTLFWLHQGGEKSIRINYQKETGIVLGFNLMGIRYRHEVCEKWLRDKTPIEQVLTSLPLANFDPEFCKEYEQDLLDLYNKQTGKPLKLKKKRSLDQVISFLTSKVKSL